ncbi:DUF3823 domain-containing protein [Pinibacter aurantiacus]|uniref:DUF3823 domain-containing protein n=1 Tax=Pinibacter aurantiacus TaxID=2851599 RepID=A0A9E2W4V4_9BACT|nr:DUF3823 domain-containing protein [Pinibacter aurantiacus]MBV4358219.1 DUF3823 domain-containing protein [Pinibacter aurantiacus]
MKKVLYMIVGTAIIGLASCSKNIDSYEGPTETLQGTFTSKLSGKPVQSDVGQDGYGSGGSGTNGNGTRIQLRELSWSANPTSQYVTGKQDGTYINTKLFTGRYELTPIGAFVPFTTLDTMDIKGGTTTKNFVVEPFYEVEWNSAPVVQADGTIQANATVTRGTNNPAYQLNMNDIWLFVNASPYIGEVTFNGTYSYSHPLTADPGKWPYGQQYTFKTKPGVKIPSGTWYIRVGARMNVTVGGKVRFNFSTPVQVTIPSAK